MSNSVNFPLYVIIICSILLTIGECVNRGVTRTSRYESCDLRTDTIRIKSNTTKHFYRCESKSGGEPGSPFGEWRRYKCKQKSMDECINKTVPVEYTNVEPPPIDNSIQISNFYVTAEPLMTRQPCRISGVPYSGASCCISDTQLLEADPTNVRLYLQCIPVANGSEYGVWVKMECPKRKLFNSLTQQCEPGFGTSVDSYGLNNHLSISIKQCLDGASPLNSCTSDVDCQLHYVCTEFEDDSKHCCQGGKPSSVSRQQFIPPAQPTCPGQPPSSVNLISCTDPSQCPVSYYCFMPARICCPQSLPLCPDASLSLPVSCVDSKQCPNGYYCPFGIGACCELTSAQTCPDGQAAVGMCVNGQCGLGFVCYVPQNICCRSFQSTCPDLSPTLPITCDVDSQCPSDYYCPLFVRQCCPRGSTGTTAGPFGAPLGAPGSGLPNQPFGFPALGPLGGPTVSTGRPVTSTAPTLLTSALCSDNSQPAGACINGLCGSGLHCETPGNICCIGAAIVQTKLMGMKIVFTPRKSTRPYIYSSILCRCLDGAEPVGPCLNGVCLTGHFCTTGNLCCPETRLFSMDQCPDGQLAVSKCFNNLCSVGYFCSPDYFCCPELSEVDTIPAFTCPGSKQLSQEHCNSMSSCSNPDFVCVNGQHCCPKPKPKVGVPVPDNLQPQQISFSIKNQCIAPIGPCINKLCPFGHYCNGKQCCKTSSIRPFVQPLTSLLVERLKPNAVKTKKCSSGFPPITRCHSGLCEPGYTCEIGSGLCCPINVRMAHVEVDPSPGLSPGSICSLDDGEQCSGAREGLSTCLQGICRCLTPAMKIGRVCALHRAHAAKKPVHLIYLLTDLRDDSYSNSSSTFQPCSNDTECNSTFGEMCISELCVQPKQLHQTCVHNFECAAICKSSECISNSNNDTSTCQCNSNTFTFNNICLRNCPSGYLFDEQTRICRSLHKNLNQTDSEPDIRAIDMC